MYEISIITSFAAAHNLRGYKGKCEAIHGHNWKVEVYLQARELDEIGLALDFKVMKKEAERLIENLDHKFLNEVSPFDKINPSSENLARYIYENLSKKLNDGIRKISRVKVWESEDAAATYFEG